MNLTITPREFARLDEARHLQVERYRTAYFKREGELPADTDPAISRRWLRVLLAGQDRCIPVSLLTDWARTFEDAQPLSISLCPNGLLVIKRGTSRLSLYTLAIKFDAKDAAYITEAYKRVDLPPAIPLIAEGNTIRLDLPDIAAELAILAKETTTNRKTVAKEKAIKRAAKAEKTALDALNRATEDAEVAQAIIDGKTLPEAIAFARRCLAARRVFVASLATLETRPAWLPATYVGEEWDNETSEFKPCTHDSAAVWGELSAALVAAIEARKAYKPINRWPSYMSQAERKAHPDRAFKVYGPAFDKLKTAEDKARRDLVGFLGSRYREHLATLGLPDSLATDSGYAWSVLHGVQAYSRARLLLRDWPARCADLTSQHAEAVATREAAEAREI